MSNSTSNTFHTHEKIRAITKTRNTASLALGEYLYHMKEEGAFKTISGDYTSFKDYLGDPDIKLSESMAYRYIKAYAKYILELGYTYEDLDGLDVTMMARVADHVTRENADEWLSRVRTLSRSDILALLKPEGKKCHYNFKPKKSTCT